MANSQKKKKPLTKAEKQQLEYKRQWDKEVRRIKQFIRRASKRGYVFDYAVPSRPEKYYKKDIVKLQKTTYKELYRTAYYADPRTGEALTGLQGRNIERAIAAEKGVETRRRNIIAKLAAQQFDSLTINDLPVDAEDISQVPYSEEEPVVDKWAEIGRRLQDEFPTRIMVTSKKGGKGKGYEVDAFAMRNSLYDIWRNTDSEVEDRKALNKFVEAHETEFAEAMDAIAVYTTGDGEIIITHDSVLSNSITKLANFLNYGKMLTQKEAENLDWLGDYYGNI